MSITEEQARMAEAVITAEMMADMEARAGVALRIDHSVNNEEATRLAILRFAGGIGDPNPLWTDEAHAAGSPYGGLVAPPGPWPQPAGHGRRPQPEVGGRLTGRIGDFGPVGPSLSTRPMRVLTTQGVPA